MGIHKFIQKVCVQTAVYWPSPTPDGYGGMSYGTPVELKPPNNGVRWDEQAEVLSDNQGKEMISKARVLTPNDLDEQGMLFLGTLDELSTAQKADPRLVEGAFEIRRFDRVPMVMSTDVFVRTAYLANRGI